MMSRPRWKMILCLWFFSILVSYPPLASSAEIKNKELTYCGNVTIHGTSDTLQKELKALQSCDVIEGHLRLHMLELPKNYTLPNLIEVTDYVVIHRVRGLLFLAKLLPRLTSIRGSVTFQGYSFILLANQDLIEVGPWSLSVIKHGAVRLESNILMCIGSKDMWGNITTDKYKTPNQFINNRNDHDSCLFEGCEEEGFCTPRPKTCTALAKGCTFKKGLSGCHRQCIGGCRTPNNPRTCAACKHLRSGSECVQSCHKDQLKYLNYRCINQAICRSLNGSIEKNASSSDTCVHQCKEGFLSRFNETLNISECKKRGDSDPCESAVLTSRNLGEDLRYCKVIAGNLIIRVEGGSNVIRQLELNLANLREVTGYIRVVGANTLFSLGFLKGLRKIGGNDTVRDGEGDDGYALYIRENANLQELWPPHQLPGLEINGSVFVRFNDRLCPAAVDALKENAKLKRDQISAAYNGGKNQCRVFRSSLCGTPGFRSGSVLLKWRHYYNGSDDRRVIGYHVFYRRTHKKVSIYEERDACNDNELWSRELIKFADPPPNWECISRTIQNLIPNERYAFYVRTLALEEEDHAVLTDVVYVNTRGTTPGKPQNGRTSIPASRKSLHLSWEPPFKGDAKRLTNDISYEVEIRIKKRLNIITQPFYGDCKDFDKLVADFLLRESRQEPQTNAPSLPSNNTSNKMVNYASLDDYPTCQCWKDLKTLLVRHRQDIQLWTNIQDIYFTLYIDTEETDEELASVKSYKRKFPLLEASKEVKAFTPHPEARPVSRRYFVPKPSCCNKTPEVIWKNTDLNFSISLDLTPKKAENGTFLLNKRTSETFLDVDLDFELETPSMIEVSVRACRDFLKPCKPLRTSSSCALCSDFLKWNEHITAKESLSEFEVARIMSQDEEIAFKDNHIVSSTTRAMSTTNLDQWKNYTAYNNNVEESLGHHNSGGTNSSDYPKLRVSWYPKPNLKDSILGYKIHFSWTTEKSLGKSICMSEETASLRNYHEIFQVSMGSVKLQAITRSGYEGVKQGEIKETVNHILQGALVALVIAALLICCVLYKILKGIHDFICRKASCTPNDNYGDTLLKDIREELWIEPSNLTIHHELKLGNGAYGKVCKGTWTKGKIEEEQVEEMNPPSCVPSIAKWPEFISNIGCCGEETKKTDEGDKHQKVITVAVKSILEDSEVNKEITTLKREERIELLLNEVKVMQDIDSNFVLRLLGVCDGSRGPDVHLHLVMEIMDNQDLKEYLRLMNGSSLMTEQSMVALAVQVADGMAYLASRNIVHRDLAARNCMMDKNLMVKVGDFGHMRYIDTDYYIQKGVGLALPVRWMAPESLGVEKKYSSKSDVWSFGVLLWEIVTCEGSPYKNFENKAIANLIPVGALHLEKPRHISEFLSSMMKECMQMKYRDRPSFPKIVSRMVPRTTTAFQEWFRDLSFCESRNCFDTESTEGYDEGFIASASLDASQDDDDCDLSGNGESEDGDEDRLCMTPEFGSRHGTSCLSKCISSSLGIGRGFEI